MVKEPATVSGFVNHIVASNQPYLLQIAGKSSTTIQQALRMTKKGTAKGYVIRLPEIQIRSIKSCLLALRLNSSKPKVK